MDRPDSDRLSARVAARVCPLASTARTGVRRTAARPRSQRRFACTLYMGTCPTRILSAKQALHSNTNKSRWQGFAVTLHQQVQLSTFWCRGAGVYHRWYGVGDELMELSLPNLPRW